MTKPGKWAGSRSRKAPPSRKTSKGEAKPLAAKQHQPAVAELDEATRAKFAPQAERIRALGRLTYSAAVEIGRTLLEVKNRMEHDMWGPWLRAEFSWSERKAQQPMSEPGQIRKICGFGKARAPD
jgi:hypothetical protein